MRDFVTPGNVEQIVQDIENHKGEYVDFSNGYLAQYADNLARRIRNSK